MNILSTIHDKRLLGSLFKDLKTWRAWLVFLRVLFGLDIEAPEDLKLFTECTGLTSILMERIREAFVICGRRSGKSVIASAIAVYLACFKDWSAYLSPGERGYIFIIAVDKAQAQIIKRYISGLLHRSAALRRMIQKETAEEISLLNNISIMIKTCSFRTLRGYTVLCAILEEVSFWRSEESANPDKEVLAAIRPALATIPESLLIGISTPYSRAGVLFDQWREHYGKPGDTLIWQSKSETMNPTIDRRLIEKALMEDPEAARAEWLAEWRQDISAFLPEEVVRAVVIPGRYELPKIRDVQYFGFADPSGGRQDSFCIAVSHREESGRIVLDVLRERVPPFRPEAEVEEFSTLFKAYGISEIQSDRYAGEWVTDTFRKFGIGVKASELTASELYLEMLPLITQGTAEILENKRLVSQLAGLERRTRSGKKDLIAHYPGGHDDCANAAAGALVMAARSEGNEGAFLISEGSVYPGEGSGWGGGLDLDRMEIIRLKPEPRRTTRVITTNESSKFRGKI